MRALASIAWRNVLRYPRRTFLTALAMGLGVMLSMVMMTLTDGLYSQMRDVIVTRTLGHVQVHHPDYPGRRGMYDTIEDASTVVDALRELDESVAVTTRLYGNALLGGEERTEGVQLIGIEPAGEIGMRKLDTKVLQGAFLGAEPGNGILLGVDLADKLEADIGDTVVAVTQAADGSMGNELYEVRGVLRVGSPMLDRSGAFLHVEDLANLLALQGSVHEITVVGADDSNPSVATLASAVGGALADTELLVRPWQEVDPASAGIFGLQSVSNAVTMFFFLAVAATGVINTLLMSVFERTRELGVLRALGVRPRELVALVVFESVFIGFLATAGGMLLGLAASGWLIVQGLDLSVDGEGISSGAVTFDPVIYGELNVATVVGPVVGVFVMAVLASLWPAWRAASLQPVEAMRGET
jgi:ABC-type lipoprotein release transport system permease subunit